MTITLVRICNLSLAITLLLTAVACTGPQGPPGPPGVGEGPPFVWICAPAENIFARQGNFGSVYVFNASLATANIAVHLLDQNGANLAGIAIPGEQSGQHYPGQPGNTTRALLPAHTSTVRWHLPLFPDNSGPTGINLDPAANLLANRSTTIRVTSDQQIVVSAEYELTDTHTISCSRLTK